MTKQFIIRHKETGEQFFTSRGKKGTWKTAGHAKAAFTTRHAYRGGFRFDEQDVYEIVEVSTVEGQYMETAEKLLKDALVHLDNTHGYETELWYSIRAFLGMD